MIFEHLRRRRLVTLLGAGVLTGAERQAAQEHLERCARCRAEHEQLRALLLRLELDPGREAEPSVPLPVLVQLVTARVESRLGGPRAQWGWPLVALPAAAAVGLAVAFVIPRVLPHFTVGPTDRALASREAPQVPAESLDRLDRALAREQAARYLNEAQDVLVTVAATPPHCARGRKQLDVSDEARRSRGLLERRALYAEALDDHAPSAQPVLHDVERVLREVAALEDCSRPEELLAIHRELEEGRLLMKLTLVQRELLG